MSGGSRCRTGTTSAIITGDAIDTVYHYHKKRADRKRWCYSTRLDLHMPIMTTPRTMRNLFIIGAEILLVKTQSTFKFTVTKMLAEAMCSAFIHSIVRASNFFLLFGSDYEISLRHHGKNQHFEYPCYHETHFRRVCMRFCCKFCRSNAFVNEHSRNACKPTTSFTTAVNDHIRRCKRSFTVVYNLKYDRIRCYFVVLPVTRFTTVYRRVVYDEIRSYTIVFDRILSFTPSYSVFIKKLQIETKMFLI
jgi:hypothetical protein